MDTAVNNNTTNRFYNQLQYPNYDGLGRDHDVQIIIIIMQYAGW